MGVRNPAHHWRRDSNWEFIVNPIVDVSLNSTGEADFAPAVRLARNLGNDRYILKAIIGYAFPVLGKSDNDNSEASSLGMGTSAHAMQESMITK
jgi:hypothetical protein